MKRILYTLALTLPMVANAQQKQAGDASGRYQLFQGSYEFVNIKGEVHWVRALFKLDTVTGAMFVCEGRQIDGKYLSPPQSGKLIQRKSCKPFEEDLVLPYQ
jgi:hypothetical protein